LHGFRGRHDSKVRMARTKIWDLGMCQVFVQEKQAKAPALDRGNESLVVSRVTEISPALMRVAIMQDILWHVAALDKVFAQ
jgi:hypothetical protein